MGFMSNGNDSGFNVSMPVAPAMGGGYGYGVPMMPAYGYGYGGNGGFFGNGSDILGILFVIALCGGGFGGFGEGWGNEAMFPWMMASNNNTNNLVQDGFNQAALSSQLSALQTGQTTGFSNAEVAACNRAMNAMQTEYQNQISDLERSFAAQQAIDARLDTIAANQQKCCCDNAAAVQDLKYTIATDGATTRTAIQAANQNILDKLCQLELDGVKSDLEAARRENISLQNQLNIAAFDKSLVAQTAAFDRSQAAQTQQLENYIRPQINPAYIVNNPYASGCCGNTNCNGYIG